MSYTILVFNDEDEKVEKITNVGTWVLLDKHMVMRVCNHTETFYTYDAIEAFVKAAEMLDIDDAYLKSK